MTRARTRSDTTVAGIGPPLATERLSRLDDGRLLYKLKRRWRDGTEAIVYEPIEPVEKLAALMPPPRFPLAPAASA